MPIIWNSFYNFWRKYKSLFYLMLSIIQKTTTSQTTGSMTQWPVSGQCPTCPSWSLNGSASLWYPHALVLHTQTIHVWKKWPTDRVVIVVPGSGSPTNGQELRYLVRYFLACSKWMIRLPFWRHMELYNHLPFPTKSRHAIGQLKHYLLLDWLI